MMAKHALALAALLGSSLVHAQPQAEGLAPLALEQAVAMALEHNLDVAIQRESIRSAEAGVLEASGAFDPSVSSGYTTSEDERPLDAESSTAAAGLTRVRTESDSVNLGLSGQTPISTRYNLAARNRSSADTFNEFEEEHNFTTSLTLTQPLLRGRGRDYTTYGIRLARRNLKVSRFDFRVQVERILIEVESAYWDLYYADRVLSVRSKSVDAAASLLKQIEVRLDVGAASEAEKVQAQSGLAQRELSLLEARRDRSRRNRTLKNLVLEDLESIAPPFALSDRPETNRAIDARAAVLEEALTRRPELKKSEIELTNARESLKRAQNDRRPQVDLEASYGVNGLGGSFGDSFDSARDGEDNNWSIGIVYRKPWPDRQNKGAVQRQASALRAEELRARQARRRIVLEIDDLLDRLEGAADQIKAGRPAVELARLNLRNERIKYEQQKSTIHNILELEAERLNAELGLSRAEVDYAKALA
ncbi:MAG: TolC family protein, partial [Verrucomicrobiota bacterium]